MVLEYMPVPKSDSGAQVLRCNGQDILNVKELMRIVESSKEPYLTFELEYNQVSPAAR